MTSEWVIRSSKKSAPQIAWTWSYGCAPSSSSTLRRMSWHFFLTAPAAGLALSRSKSISVCWRHPELGEQVVDHRRAVGIQDLALDRADPEMLERGVHLGRHLGHALVHHRLHALEHALRAEGAHVLHLVGEDGVLERDVRHHQRAGLALVRGVLDRRRTAGGGLDEVEAALALLDHHRGGGDALLAEQAELADPTRDVGHLVDGIGQRHHGEGGAGEDVQSGHQRCPPEEVPGVSGR